MPNARRVITRRRFGLLVTVALAVLWLSWHWLIPKPSFQGKTAAQWFQEMPMDKRGQANAPLQALRQFRPSALPFLFQMAQKQDSFWTRAHRSIHPRLPKPVQRWFPLPPETATTRHKAIWTLSAWDPPPVEAVPLLTKALQDRQHGVRAQAAEVIRQIGYPARESATALLVLLQDADGQIRDQAVQALYALQSQAWTSNQPLAAVTNAIPQLALALRDSHLGVRITVANLFWYVGPAAVQAKAELVAALRDPNEHVRGHALYALGQMGPAVQDAVTEILLLANDPSKQVRCFVMQVLPKVAPRAKETVPVFQEGLKDREQLVRADAALALSELGPLAASAVPALAAALQDDYGMVQLYACRALRNLGPAAQAAVPALTATLRNNSIAREAREALKQIGSGQVPKAPYPASPVIKEIVWAPTNNIVRQAPDGDNWPITWAADDALYTTWGDGTGFAPKVPDKLSCGFARVTGQPPEFTGTNIRSSAEQFGQGRDGLKSWGILAVGDTLYLWFGHANKKGGESRLAWSRDDARTWTFADWSFAEFGLLGFINFGRAYEGARDDFVYAYSHDGPMADTPANRFVLLRVPRDSLADRSGWQFFAGQEASGEPRWTSEIGQRAGVFQNQDACLRSAMTYHAGLKRYLWWHHVPRTPDHSDRGDTRFEGGFGIYDAPEPWGPWTTAFFTNKWDVGPGEHGDFPTKWMSPDGHTAWLVFSGDDAFSVRQATFRLHSQ